MQAKLNRPHEKQRKKNNTQKKRIDEQRKFAPVVLMVNGVKENNYYI
jgi:bisphosphoglycerate-independent phosphoglycerate mutase (AlkP superfamily)